MAVEVIVPSLGEVVEEVTILHWFKSEGDRVNKEEPLLEVESEKVTNVWRSVSDYRSEFGRTSFKLPC